MRREFPWKEGNYEITRREENEKKMNILDQLLRASWTNIFANLPRSLTRRVSIRIGRGERIVHSAISQVLAQVGISFRGRDLSYIPRETAHVHRRLPRCGGFASALNHLQPLQSGRGLIEFG